MTALDASDMPEAAAADAADGSGTASRQRFERLYHVIRERICLLDYAPGAKLSEEALAHEFAISRTPIRRVLARLEFDGLVESRHGVGTFVTDAGFEDLAEVYRLRMELAEITGRLDPQPPDPEAAERVREILRGCDALSASPDAQAFARLNMAFFFEVAALSRNRTLSRIAEMLYFQTTRIWLASMPRAAFHEEVAAFRREVADVLAALEVEDLESVGYIRRGHLSMSFVRLQRYAGVEAG